MSVSCIQPTSYRPFLQTLLVPLRLITALFLKIIGRLLLFLGEAQWGNYFRIYGEKIISRCSSLCNGLWIYGRRFLVHSDNYEATCRGSCYWVIDQHFRDPDKPLSDIVQAFEEGAPDEAIALHRHNALPANLKEIKQSTEEIIHEWPPMPQLDPGTYTFLLGYSKNSSDHGKAHRFTLFKEGARTTLFDPNTGLSEWSDADWKPLLNRIAADIRSSPAGYFTLERYSYTN